MKTMTAQTGSASSARLKDALIETYEAVRAFTETLCEPLEPEDMVVQTMPEMSPTRWHIAHTTWFFETFILKEFATGYKPANEAFEYLFNSYYNAVGDQFPRPQRGHLSRPTVPEVFEYRRRIDESMRSLLDSANENTLERLRPLLEIGVNHEQQHQELMLTDIKHAFAQNPLFPVYAERHDTHPAAAVPAEWIGFDGGMVTIGYSGAEFCYDNEEPQHQTFLNPFELQSRLITAGEYLEFIGDGGYSDPLLWLSEGWATIQNAGWQAPSYWHRLDDGWHQYTLSGLRPIEAAEPVCHLSYFEADAFARWAGARLPLETEWEVAAHALPLSGNFVESGAFHPRAATAREGRLDQIFGDVWEWTASPYTAYPGYKPAPGAIGEYNGKFMCNQYVLRGGSCATSVSHIRPTYRNFFPAGARWQFSGIRLARDTS